MRIGIIGYPIGHSISPSFQQAALDHYSLDAAYEAWEVAPDALREFMVGLRSPDSMGISVTVPHKENVMAHLDQIDPWARMAGAVNTIVHKSGQLVGHNTDGRGFIRALEQEAHFTTEDCRALIIGAGGSAKAVALSLAGHGAGAITIANRTIERARSLAKTLSEQGSFGIERELLRIEAVSLSNNYEGIAGAASESDLIVNCTTLGMNRGPTESLSPLSADVIPKRALVYDLVYNPPETPLLREAARSGAATLGGLPMLVYQGAAAFELWTGKAAPVEVMMGAAKAALGVE